MLILGRCHCGNIAFQLDWKSQPESIPARACSCSFCTRHGGVWTSNREGSLHVTIGNRALVEHYAFGTGTAQFHVCRKCGVVPVVTSAIEGRRYAVVNVNCFENVPESLLHHVPVTFDEEATENRLARRARGWIADVHFDEGSEV